MNINLTNVQHTVAHHKKSMLVNINMFINIINCSLIVGTSRITLKKCLQKRMFKVASYISPLLVNNFWNRIIKL